MHETIQFQDRGGGGGLTNTSFSIQPAYILARLACRPISVTEWYLAI